VILNRKIHNFNDQMSLLPCGESRSALLGIYLIFFYILPATVLPLWGGVVLNKFLAYGNRVLIIACVIFLLAKGINKTSKAGILFIALTFPGVLASEYFFQSYLKWVGWALLFAVVGPFIQSDQARTLRFAAWKTLRLAFIVISTTSFAWYILGLPNLGRGVFTGTTVHSMLLGPIAGMTVLFCANYAIIRRSIVYATLSLLAIIPCLLTGSRTAVLALIPGTMVLVSLSFRRIGLRKSFLAISVTLFLGSLGVALFQGETISDMNVKYTDTLEEKGLQNSRKELWAARLKEFWSSPAFGVGIGMGEGGEEEGVVKDAAGSINVEPGSSYLAMLSMTGIVGAVGFLLVFVGTYRGVWINRQVIKSNPFLPEALAIGAFLTAHMVTEGWIYAVGSPICLLFWLCLGYTKDLIDHRQEMNPN
jgi:hypothetical protein